jgi:DNA-binding MarR family transcriptional regulator
LLLKFLYEHGSARQQEIVDSLDLEKSGVGTSLDRLEAAGLITIERLRSDYKTAVITAKGREKVEQALPAWNAIRDKIASTLPPEIRALSVLA